jgi:hypothetical protein
MGYILEQLSDEHLDASLKEAKVAYRRAQDELEGTLRTLNALEAEATRRFRRRFAEAIERPALPPPLNQEPDQETRHAG